MSKDEHVCGICGREAVALVKIPRKHYKYAEILRCQDHLDKALFAFGEGFISVIRIKDLKTD